MPIYDIYSKRKRIEQGEGPDVFQYEEIPKGLRNQIANNLALLYSPGGLDSLYGWLELSLANEYGLRDLRSMTGLQGSSILVIERFITERASTDQVLDAIELAFGPQFDIAVENFRNSYDLSSLEESIKELNFRFREHGVGYQFEAGKMVRTDSQLIHSEVIRPALQMLSGSMYVGANEEFLSALEHYRKGRHKECLVESLKAFESCMKAICEKRGWQFDEGDNASRLISIMFDKELIPRFMQTHFTSLKSALESGVPTLRNKLGGHGQGSKQTIVPDFVAAHIIHLAASNILLLSRADEEK